VARAFMGQVSVMPLGFHQSELEPLSDTLKALTFSFVVFFLNHN
jgi:hypothetical protein